MQTHRCPATVSGSKSAETTEVLYLGKVQRVGECREPGDLPYMALRRPFEGKGRQRVCADPDRTRLGFFYACCFPCRVEQPSFPHVGEEEERGKQAVVPPAALLPSVLHTLAETASHVCWGCSTACRRTSTRGQPAMVWQRIHTPVRLSGGVARQEGGEEHDLCDCGTLH